MELKDLIPFTRSKAVNSQQTLINNMNKQLFRFHGGNYPISIEDTQDGYVSDGYEGNPDVYSVVNGITMACASVPPIVHVVKNVEKAEKYRRIKHNQRNGTTKNQVDQLLELKQQAFEEVSDHADPLYKMIHQPNPLQSYPEWYENMKGFQLITGNSYTHFVVCLVIF